MEKLAHNEWIERLKNSDIDPQAVRSIIELETDMAQLYETMLDPVVERILSEYDRKGHLKLDDLVSEMRNYYGDFASEFAGLIKIYYRTLINVGRENAYQGLGFEREARRKLMRKKAAIDTDVAYEDAVSNAFTKVKTVDDEVIDRLKEDWIDQGGPTDVVKNFLLDEEDELRSEGYGREELRERLKQLWREKRYIIERIIRTESVNTYSKVQLQEWYDQGIREVERVEINDLKTCDLCRAISEPGRNVFLIEDLLKEEYPVTFITHPNCRGTYRPRVNLSVFEDFGRRLKEFQNASDLEMPEGKAKNVPIEYQKQVEKAIQDFGPEYDIEFTPDITQTSEWQKDRLEELREFYPESEAKARLEMEKSENEGRILQYTTSDGKLYVSGDAGDVNRIVIPVLRNKAENAWMMAPEDAREWVEERYERKTSEIGKTLEEDGVEIIGSNPFISTLAETSAEQYFVEAYATYVADPIRLLYTDEPMYNFLRERFMSSEYLVRGGIK